MQTCLTIPRRTTATGALPIRQYYQQQHPSSTTTTTATTTTTTTTTTHSTMDSCDPYIPQGESKNDIFIVRRSYRPVGIGTMLFLINIIINVPQQRSPRRRKCDQRR